jgi:hypothetical protein
MTRRAPTPPTEARTSPEITEAASAIMPSITETATTMEPTSAQHEDISQQHEIANLLHGANPLALAAIKNFLQPSSVSTNVAANPIAPQPPMTTPPRRQQPPPPDVFEPVEDNHDSLYADDLEYVDEDEDQFEDNGIAE